MPRWERPVWRTIRIPHRTIERVYGSDNLDDAGDDIVNALRLVSESPNQYRYRFGSDFTHSNPWYHELIFEIEGIPDSAYERFVEELISVGLMLSSETM